MRVKMKQMKQVFANLILIALAVFLVATPVYAMPLDGTEIPKPPLREFPSLEFFEHWRDTKLLLYIHGEPYRLPIKTYSSVKDCDDVAEAWQREALSSGYLVSQQIIEYGKLLGKRVSEAKRKHDGILTMIGNDVYYLDTYPPYRITWVINRD